jgi:hypothetical protein
LILQAATPYLSNMRLQWIPLLIAFSAVPSAPQIQPEPYSVKADKLGETLTAWKTNNPRLDKCENDTVDNRIGSAVDPDVVYCIARSWEDDQNLTFATAPLLTETAWFYKGSLYKVEMTLLNRFGLPDVMAGRGTKLGAPSGRETTPMQNGFGASFEEDRWTWANKVSTAELVYTDAPDDCPQVTFTLDAPNKEVTDRQKQVEEGKARSDT